MSVGTDGVGLWAVRDRVARLLPRVIALVGAGLLLASFLTVLQYISDVTGQTTRFHLIVALALVGATLLARTVRVGIAVAVSVAIFVVGLAWYVVALPHNPPLAGILDSNVKLLTGQSILRIRDAGVWALVVTPTPVFVTWYLALRRWYSTGALVGGVTLGYFVLTGDAGTTTTLLGVVGAVTLVGFGDLDRRDVSADVAGSVAVVLAVMVLAPLVITVVPGGAGSPTGLFGDETVTMEGNVVEAGNELDIVGGIQLTPDVRFTVESEEPSYWRTGSYDRYTGDGWVRSGETASYDDVSLRGPRGDATTLRQRVTTETPTQALPAAWRPTGVTDIETDKIGVTAAGGLQYDGTIAVGETYEVVSQVPEANAAELAERGTNYPDEIEKRYTQLPDSTPGRVAERTDRITQNAQNPLDRAVLIEQWLETNRDYSLDIDRPGGDIADSFLFEMEEGYCTYYATTMVTMLRTQDIPARLVVGYTPGEQVDEDEWVARGLNSHVWVEVYFPRTGWVQFDPTPVDPREEAEQDRVESARESGDPTVDTEETRPEGQQTEETDDQQNRDESTENGTDDQQSGLSETLGGIESPSVPDEASSAQDGANDSSTEQAFADETCPVPSCPEVLEEDNATGQTDGNGSGGSGVSGGGGGLGLPDHPPGDELALGTIAVVGVLAGLERSSRVQRLWRQLVLRVRRRSDPETDIERAHERLVLALESRHRPRKSGETMRAYLDAIDAGPRARRVARLREQARYSESISREQADEALELVDSLDASETVSDADT